MPALNWGTLSARASQIPRPMALSPGPRGSSLLPDIEPAGDVLRCTSQFERTP